MGPRGGGVPGLVGVKGQVGSKDGRGTGCWGGQGWLACREWWGLGVVGSSMMRSRGGGSQGGGKGPGLVEV